MGIADFTFYLFACTTVLAGFFVVVSRNPVHSVLWLILTFLSSAGLFVLIGAEFVAMLLVIVYVGAVGSSPGGAGALQRHLGPAAGRCTQIGHPRAGAQEFELVVQF